jgi:hypothetical protein
LSIQSTATTTKKKELGDQKLREMVVAKEVHLLSSGHNASFPPPLPEVLSFALTSPHISRLVPVPLPRAKAPTFLYTSATAKAAPLVIYLCNNNNNNLAATLLLQLFNTSATAKLQLSSTSAAAAAAKLPTFLYLCNSSTAPTCLQNQQKKCSQIHRLCSKI